jgi:putative transposase
MPETDSFSGCIDWIDLEFVKKEETPQPLMKLSIELHVAGLSLRDTVSVLEGFGVERARSTVHNWVQKADLQPAAGRSPEQVAVDETVINLNNDRYWLFAAVEPETNVFLHVRLFPARNEWTTLQFFRQLLDRHDVEDATFLVDNSWTLQNTLDRLGLRFHYERHGNRNSVERVFKELKRRTKQFANHFRNASHASAENWLQAFAAHWNQLI